MPTNQRRFANQSDFFSPQNTLVSPNQSALFLLRQPISSFAVVPINQQPSCTMFCTNHSPALRQPSRTVLLFRQPISTVLYFIKPTKEMVSCTIFYANQLRLSVTKPISTVVLLRQPISTVVLLTPTNQHCCTITPTNQHRCSVTPKNQPCCTATPTNEMPSCTIFCTNQHRCSVTPSNQMPSCNIFCTNQP